MFSTLHSISVT